MLMELNNVLANALRNALATKLASGPGPLMSAEPLNGDSGACCVYCVYIQEPTCVYMTTCILFFT